MSDVASFVGDRYYRSQFDTGIASYTIFKNGNNYYADPGFPGGTPASGTDAATVIQSAVNALSTGGKIIIKSGNYSLATKILVSNSNIVLQGEGQSTILTLGNNANDHMFSLSASGFMLCDMILKGNGMNQTFASGSDGQCGIHINDVAYTTGNFVFERLIIQDFANHGIKAIGTTFARTDILIRNCEIKNCGNNASVTKGTDGYGIYPAGFVTRVAIENNYIHDNINGGEGISAGGGSGGTPSAMRIIANYLDNNPRYGIDTSEISDLIIKDNFVTNSTASLDVQSYGIFSEGITPGTKGVVIEGNYLYKNGFYSIVINGPTNKFIIRNNYSLNLKGDASSTGQHIFVGTVASNDLSDIQIEQNVVDGTGDTNACQGIVVYISAAARSISRLKIAGNIVNGVNKQAILVDNTNGGTINNAIITNNITTNSMTSNGITVINLVNATISGNQSTNNANYQLILQMNSNNNVVIGNQLGTGGAGPLLNQGIGNRITDNIGYNPQPVSGTLTAGASPYTVPSQPYPYIFLLAAANGISAATLDAIPVPITINQPILVNPAHTLILTWATTAPTFKELPQ